MPFKTLKEVVHERLLECAESAQSRFRQAVRPIYGVTLDGRPEQLGSAILLRLPEGHFMVTAAHNLDWNTNTSIYLGVRKAELLDLTATATVAPYGNRDDDVFDFAVAQLPESLVMEIGEGSFVNEAQISPSVADSVGRTYTSLGYPNSKNRTPRRFETKVTPKIASYTSNGISTDRLGHRCTADTHILIDFNFKYSRDEDGKRVNSIKPNGFSGGAVIDLGRLSDPSTLPEPCDPKLIGLFIEAHRAEKAIVATRLTPAIKHLRANGHL
jgi:hypothetical protein